MMASSDTSRGFVHQLQSLLEWIDSEAKLLPKEDILDSMKVRVLVLAKKFIAYPHCDNFSLMPQPKT
jgi:hypothetical protein